MNAGKAAVLNNNEKKDTKKKKTQLQLHYTFFCPNKELILKIKVKHLRTVL